MKLYEFKLCKDEITVDKYEVRETEKLYIVQKEENERGYINYNALTRIPKYIVDGEVQVTYRDVFFYSLSNDIENAKNAFIKYLQTKKIPQCERNVNIATEKLNECKNTLKSLMN